MVEEQNRSCTFWCKGQMNFGLILSQPQRAHAHTYIFIYIYICIGKAIHNIQTVHAQCMMDTYRYWHILGWQWQSTSHLGSLAYICDAHTQPQRAASPPPKQCPTLQLSHSADLKMTNAITKGGQCWT
jgi:hypothetical protein